LNQEDAQIVIIGCGAGGGTAAQFARKTDRKGNITVFEKGKYPQYSKCGLPYAISGVIPQINDLIEFDEEWFKKQKIDLFLNTNVEKIDTNKKIIYARKEKDTIEKNYDKIIIATGAKPFIPPIENIKSENKLVKGVFVLRTIDDAEEISNFIKKGASAVIVGAGFIGLELAESFKEKGLKVTVIEALENVLPRVFDSDMSDLIEKEISDKIQLITNHLVTRIETQNNTISNVIIKDKNTNSEAKIKTDILVIGTGCKAESTLAKNAGCLLGKFRGIVVNNKSETSLKNIYAVGDCTEFIDYISKKDIPIGLGSIAVRQAIAAGINAAGGEYNLLDGMLQTCTSTFFGLEVAAVGLTNKELMDYKVVSAKYNGSSLPEYFPGGKKITIKLNVDEKTKKILGAQAVGDKASQRINTFACAILADLDIETLKKLETAYAPPIAPTLDAETLVCDIVSMKLARLK
jgi:NADH oxidase (H2O2-forming)